MATITNLLEMGRERNVGSAQGNHGELPCPSTLLPLTYMKRRLCRTLGPLLSY